MIASTASPYKFTRSVMDAIDAEKYEGMGDFELVDAAERTVRCESSAGDRRDPYRTGSSQECGRDRGYAKDRKTVLKYLRCRI